MKFDGFLSGSFHFCKESGKQCPWIAIRLPALLVEGFPQAPLNAEFHSAAARPLDALNHALAYRWAWSFSFSVSCSASIFSRRSTLAFAVNSSRISSRERRYSAQLPHFFTGAPIFGIGFFLFLQNLGILGL